MNHVSGGSSKNLFIQQRENVLSSEDIMPGSFYDCSHDDKWCFVVAKLYFGRQLWCEH